ncbi:DUF192 domain-containing protein [Rhodobiaceae bacterium]|jgi:hypothetical protein|nr:DUF192 domain-containing protein [Rhodobiaceae bacterium]|tara:strand:- start:530 stop:970 length:441 start_codon:yes stop_codon:yes gene_type:complete
MKYFIQFLLLIFFINSLVYAGSFNNIKILKSNGEYIDYKVEIMSTPADQQRGLMFREKLNSNEGMLFLFDKSKKASFWMKNTIISLDLIYIKENGLVDSIYQDLTPMSLKKIQSKSKVRAALEIPAGDVELHGINYNSFINIDFLK